MTPAQQQTHTSNRTLSHQRRHPDDPLSDADIDRVVLRAIEAGADYAGIQQALREARDAAWERMSE